MTKQVLVVIGTGGMGAAVARRLGSGRTIVLADFNRSAADALADQLQGQGHDARGATVDVSSRQSVEELARLAAELGEVTTVVHTAGVSPVQASIQAVLTVDLLGTAHVLDSFSQVIAPGGAAVVIASMAGHYVELPADVAAQLALTPTGDLLSLPCTSEEALQDPGAAYSLAKRANELRVQAASATAWRARGARVNSLSPGIICTPMGRQELDGADGGAMRAMIQASNAQRMGTPDDIAAAVEFLVGPAASFISGTDLLVDGGVVAAVRNGLLGHLQA